MKSTLLLLLCSSVLYAQSTRKVQWSLKGGVGYYRNAASYIDLKESVIDTKVFDVYNFKPYVGRFYTVGIGAKYKRFTAEIGYCKPTFITTADFKWTPFVQGHSETPYYATNAELTKEKIAFYSFRLGYIYPFFKGRLELIPNVGIGYSKNSFRYPWQTQYLERSNGTNFVGSLSPSTLKRNQINIQVGIELNFKLSQDEVHNIFLSGLINRNIHYLYSADYYWQNSPMKYSLKNGGHYAYLTLGYKLNL